MLLNLLTLKSEIDGARPTGTDGATAGLLKTICYTSFCSIQTDLIIAKTTFFDLLLLTLYSYDEIGNL